MPRDENSFQAKNREQNSELSFRLQHLYGHVSNFCFVSKRRSGKGPTITTPKLAVLERIGNQCKYQHVFEMMMPIRHPGGPPNSWVALIPIDHWDSSDIIRPCKLFCIHTDPPSQGQTEAWWSSISKGGTILNSPEAQRRPDAYH